VWEYWNSLRDGAGGPIVIGAARDVTERVLSQRALRASENRFATAFYSSPIAMAITTLAEGRYVDVNEAFERQMGYARAEVCGRTSLELNVWPSPDDRRAMISTLLRQKTLRSQNAQFRTSSGSLITTLYSAGLITLDGRPCVLAAIADITAQKLAEDTLRESESKFRLLAETTLSGIFIYRDNGAFCYFNSQVEGFTGYSAEELRSMTVWDLVHPDFRELVRARARERYRGDNVPSRYEIKIITKGGASRWIDFTAVLIEFERQRGILGTAMDVTERVESQAKLQALRDRLTRFQDEERAHIARELHDDIGQRLALLALQLAELQETARDAAPSLGEQLDRAARLTGEICKDANRLSRRLHPSQLAHLGLAKALSGFCQEFSRQTRIQIDFDHHGVPELSSDVRTCLYRVAQEAMRNAEKHSGSPRVRVQLAGRPGSVWLCVSDEGKGFDLTAAQRGTGLGLVSMAERARSVGGELSVRSEVDRGTRIEVSIPLPAPREVPLRS
jgi:PAS domain S-box-containing protein